MLHSQMKIVNCAVSTNDLHYKGKHLMFHDVVLFVLVLKDFTDHIVNRAINRFPYRMDIYKVLLDQQVYNFSIYPCNVDLKKICMYI
jgi:hypothetical protein